MLEEAGLFDEAAAEFDIPSLLQSTRRCMIFMLERQSNFNLTVEDFNQYRTAIAPGDSTSNRNTDLCSAMHGQEK